MRRLALCACIAIAAAAGCGRRGQQVGASPAEIKPRAKTVLTIWTIWNSEPRKSTLEEIARRFEMQRPDVRVSIRAVEPDAYKTAIRVAVGSDQPPDIFFVWGGEWMRNFVREGAVLDITRYMDENNGQWRKRIYEHALKRFSYRGRVWGVPFLLQCTFFFYNKKLFAEHGWQVPKTWPELLGLVHRIKEAGYIPIALGNAVKWPAHHFPSVLWQRLLGEETVEREYDPLHPSDYSDPRWLKGLKMFKQLVDMGAFNPSPNATTREAARALFYTGKAAMFYTGTWNFSRFRRGGEAPEEFCDDWDFFNFPAVPGGAGDQEALTGGADGYVISAKSQHPEVAVAFLRFMTSLEMAQLFVSRCKEFAQVKGAVTADNADWALRKYADMVAAAKHISQWADTLMERSVAEVLLNGCQAILDGRATPEQVLEQVRKRHMEVYRELAARFSPEGAPGGG